MLRSFHTANGFERMPLRNCGSASRGFRFDLHRTKNLTVGSPPNLRRPGDLRNVLKAAVAFMANLWSGNGPVAVSPVPAVRRSKAVAQLTTPIPDVRPANLGRRFLGRLQNVWFQPDGEESRHLLVETIAPGMLRSLHCYGCWFLLGDGLSAYCQPSNARYDQYENVTKKRFVSVPFSEKAP